MKTQFKSYLHGKLISYSANAQHNANIASLLIEYVKTKEVVSEPNSARIQAAKLINNTSDYKRQEKIIVKAFTLYQINGHLDYIAANLLEKIVNLKKTSIKNKYKNESTSLINLFTPWLQILIGNFNELHQFAQNRASITISLKPNEIVQEIKEVQQQNIKRNKKTIEQLSSRKAKKGSLAETILLASKHSENSQLIIASAINTQKAASNWDKIFISLLKLKYKN